jgi:ubiquinone/menaquinone biosynthesis C-methylase UbiE
LIRWAFARFYREFAWTYDTVAWLVSRGLWQRWVLSARPYLMGRVLELGCGPGYMQAALQGAPVLAAGIDASPQMLALARRRVASAMLLRALAQALPFSARSFDTVLATFPAEYILDPTTISEIDRVLAAHGRVVFVDAAHFTRSGAYEQATDALYRATLHSSVQQQIDRYPPAEQLARYGFSFTEHWEQVEQSLVMVAVGVRVDAGLQ